MDSLPSEALKVIELYLDPQDAASCRLAARCLGLVRAKQLPTSHIRVVANSFQLQLQHESSTSSSRSAAATAVAATSSDPPTQDVGQLLIASEDHQHQNAPAGKPTTAAATPLAAGAAGGDDVTCSPSFRSRTAASLARAAAAGYSKAFVYVDVLQEYSDQTWQELFGALLSSSSSISTLTIVEYCSTSLNTIHIEGIITQRRALADIFPEVTAASSLPGPVGAAAAAAVSTAGSSNWLPALVAAYTPSSPDPGGGPSLKHLELQLPAPLPMHLQPLLVQLTGLKTLALYPTRVWPLMDEAPAEPVITQHVLQGLTQLSNLESLTCCVAAPTSSLEDSQVNVVLQQVFSDLGRHMTHLSFGTWHRQGYHPNLKPQVQLSAPLVSMYDLRSLVCKGKFSLDTGDALKSLSKEAAKTATSGTLVATSSSSSSISSSPRLQIAPSLTKLVLSNESDHGSLLRLLAGNGIITAAARSTSQLVHLELDGLYGAKFPVDELSQLSGLSYLKAVVQESDELTSFCKSSLTSQLQGLTLSCKVANQWDGSVVRYRPMQSVTSFTALHSLAILAEQEVILHPVEDLELLCDLTHLTHLIIKKQYGQYETIKLGSDTFRKLPSALHSLVFKLYLDRESRGVNPRLKFAAGAFPSSLSALEFEGFFVEAIAEMEVSSSAGTSHTTTSVASLSGRSPEAAPVQATHSMICGSISHSGIVIPFPNLRRLSADFNTTDHAQEFLRGCRKLQTLNMRTTVPLGSHDPRSDDEDDGYPYEASTVSLRLSDWCPQLSNLSMTLTGNCKTILPIVQPADGLFEMIWPGVPNLTGLQELAITAVGTLSYDTIMPCLAAISCLSRLRDLTLHFKLEVSCLRAQYANKHQQKHEQQGHSAAASSSESDERSLRPGTRLSLGDEESFELGQPVAIHKLGVHDLLFKALHGCTALRRLALNGSIVIVDGGPHRVGKSMTIDFMFEKRQRLVQLERGLRNCLVLGSDQHVDSS